MNIIKFIIPPIHREGYYFIGISALASVIMGLFIPTLGWLGSIITVWCMFFFRDPPRVTPLGEQWVISTADGIVQKIEAASPPEELQLGNELRTRISIFLNVFNVHVNRVPTSGRITRLHYRPGKFVNASLDKASEDNERQSVAMVSNYGNKEIVFVQIAGLVARRIICDLEEGQQVQGGSRFGIIRFGSRMDIYLPEGVNPLVMEGQTVVGGETILADLSSLEAPRKGEVL